MCKLIETTPSFTASPRRASSLATLPCAARGSYILLAHDRQQFPKWAGEGVKVLFIGLSGKEEPWLGDVVRALDGAHELAVFDHAGPLDVQFAGVRVVVDQGGWATRAMIDAGAAAGVELWQVLGTGVDHSEVDHILASGIQLANTPGPFSAVALAEHALFLMLCLAKNLREAERNLEAGIQNLPINDELGGKVLGLVGLGASGRELARRAGAFAMDVIAVDVVEPSPDELDALAVRWFGAPTRLPDLLRESDYVSLHVPLTPQTAGLIGGAELGLMKPDACLINVARGRLVDEEALVGALRAGNLRGAGIDVFTIEPPDPAHPLLQLDNVIVTPHVAGVTTGTSRRRGAACAENIGRLADGLPPLYEITTA
jgi:phosphoglycerate dehydrogenase-like enzyme